MYIYIYNFFNSKIEKILFFGNFDFFALLVL